MRKRVAVLSSQLEEEYQKEFITGFQEKAIELDYDVCVFASFQKEPESNKRSISEVNIFNLVNFDMFDAVVVMPDILQVSGLMMRIETNLKNYKGKVLYIDRESDIYPYIMIDHYAPIYRLICHLIDEHNYDDIAFITGHKWHTHSKQRLQAYMDCMKDHNLPVREDRIFYGDFWYTGGMKIIGELVNSRQPMPRAFACANDYMAIGVAEALTEAGYKIPEDVAVIGYDSVKEGQQSPVPITSAFLPTKDFGNHAAICVEALLSDKPLPKFNNKSDIFKGGSCGCPIKTIVTAPNVRDSWIDSKEYFLSFNRLTEDLVLQPTFKGLIDTVQTYSYMIREFESFDLCLNDCWVDGSPVSTTEIKEGYTENMALVLHCGPSGKGADVVSYDTRVRSDQLIPQLHEESEKPRTFIISPVFFDDITFGYSVISYGDVIKTYNESYCMWLRSVMIGIECYRRNAILQENNNVVQEIQIHDALTNMFNYEGFIKHSKPMIERGNSIDNQIMILAFDMNGLDKINSTHGRKEGDNAIKELSKLIMDSSDEGAMCCRLGNDEFIVAELTADNYDEMKRTIRQRLQTKLDAYNASPDNKYQLSVYSGSAVGKINNLAQMEDLVNTAVSHKNGNKATALRIANTKTLTDEEKHIADIVQKILDDNLFTYHFQPIVSAKDGSIYAYEALMRAQVQERISPLDIIKYATHFERLYDVEKATFFNVINKVSNDKELFSNRKIFINSIPGNQLKTDDALKIKAKVEELNHQLVVELTEQTEADDDSLDTMKKIFEMMGIETAVDDYGTGYSNIVNLLRYMPNYVKIDRMLLSNIQDNPQKQHFVKDIVLFAHDNHFKVLAEGIETAEELETVIKLNVDLIQGYYTARPNAEIIQSISEEVASQIRAFAS